MGGYGSGRKKSFDRKTNTNECFVWPVSTLKDRLIDGKVFWVNHKKNIGTMRLRCEVNLEENSVNVSYGLLAFDSQNKTEDTIFLDSTNVNFGGSRTWFLCPNKSCGKRAGKLYRPYSKMRFHCRNCHDLAYKSSQTAHSEELEQASFDRLTKELLGEARLQSLRYASK